MTRGLVARSVRRTRSGSELPAAPRTLPASRVRRLRPPPSGEARPPPPRRSWPSCASPLRSSTSARSDCGCARSSALSRANASSCDELRGRVPTREGVAESPAARLWHWRGLVPRGPRWGPRRARTRPARSRRAALAPSRPAACTGAGAARASFEDDQDLALLDHLALLHPHLFHGARAGRGHRDLHLHRLQDQELVLLGHPRAGLGLHLPDAPYKLGLHFGHRVFKHRIL